MGPKMIPRQIVVRPQLGDCWPRRFEMVWDNGVRVNELTYYMTRAIDARDHSYLLMSND